MKPEDIERLERLALAQVGKDIGTVVRLTPGELLALCQLAREGQGKAAGEAKPE